MEGALKKMKRGVVERVEYIVVVLAVMGINPIGIFASE